MPTPLAISRSPIARRRCAIAIVHADRPSELARRDDLGHAERDAEPAERLRESLLVDVAQRLPHLGRAAGRGACRATCACRHGTREGRPARCRASPAPGRFRIAGCSLPCTCPHRSLDSTPCAGACVREVRMRPAWSGNRLRNFCPVHGDRCTMLTNLRAPVRPTPQGIAAATANGALALAQVRVGQIGRRRDESSEQGPSPSGTARRRSVCALDVVPWAVESSCLGSRSIRDARMPVSCAERSARPPLHSRGKRPRAALARTRRVGQYR